MEKEKKYELSKIRGYRVVKANEIIQKSRFNLSVLEQKTIAYIISMIKPKDNPLEENVLEYIFDIQEYCKVCGIDYDSGRNYENIKTALKKLRDKSMWITEYDGSETTVSWISKVNTNKRSGKAKIKLDEDMIPYLFDLQSRFTQYELHNTLLMQSQYGLRLYEIFKSYAFAKKKVFETSELKRLLMVENIKSYENFKEFRKYVLEISLREINEHTDIEVSYEPITKGRGGKVVQIAFEIKEKDWLNKYCTYKKVIDVLDGNDVIEGQIIIDEYVAN